MMTKLREIAPVSPCQNDIASASFAALTHLGGIGHSCSSGRERATFPGMRFKRCSGRLSTSLSNQRPSPGDIRYRDSHYRKKPGSQSWGPLKCWRKGGYIFNCSHSVIRGKDCDPLRHPPIACNLCEVLQHRTCGMLSPSGGMRCDLGVGFICDRCKNETDARSPLRYSVATRH